MNTSIPTKTPASAGADRAARVLGALALILSAAEREYARGAAGPTSRAALHVGGIYAADIEATARRAARRIPTLAADLRRLPALLEVCRRLAAASPALED